MEKTNNQKISLNENSKNIEDHIDKIKIKENVQNEINESFDLFHSEKEKNFYKHFKTSNLVHLSKIKFLTVSTFFLNNIKIVGQQIAQKQKILTHILTNLLLNFFLESSNSSNNKPTFKILYVDSEGNFSPSYFNKTIKKFILNSLNSNKITKEKAIEINKLYENSIYFYKIFSFKDTSQLLETELIKILNLEEKEYNFKIIVFDNLNSFLYSKSTMHGNSLKLHKKNLHDLYILAKKKNLLILFMNNLKFVKLGEEFCLKPENEDFLNEFMDAIILVEGNENNRDEYKIKIMKSSWDDGEYWIEMKKNKLIFE